MTSPIREIPLSNGITVRFFDATRRYFGDYHQVRVKITFEVPLRAEFFDDPKDYEAAGKLLGAKVKYLKEIEHQGVPTSETAGTVEKVIAQFVAHSLSYFEGADFPRRFAQAELKKMRSKSSSFQALRPHV